MIKQKGTAIFQNKIDGANIIKAIFPLTETDISFKILKTEHSGLKHTLIESIKGNKVELTANINMLFPLNNVTSINSNLITQYKELAKIIKEKKEFYYMAYSVPSYGVYSITQEDVDENRAYKVKIKDELEINNFVDHLEIAGQIVTIHMKSLNLIDITDSILSEGYGKGGYGEQPYGNPTS